MLNAEITDEAIDYIDNNLDVIKRFVDSEYTKKMAKYTQRVASALKDKDKVNVKITQNISKTDFTLENSIFHFLDMATHNPSGAFMTISDVNIRKRPMDIIIILKIKSNSCPK